MPLAMCVPVVLMNRNGCFYAVIPAKAAMRKQFHPFGFPEKARLSAFIRDLHQSAAFHTATRHELLSR
jgi:hypothetical protein